MRFKPVHENYNVRDLTASIEFYGKALGLQEVRRINADDGVILFLASPCKKSRKNSRVLTGLFVAEAEGFVRNDRKE